MRLLPMSVIEKLKPQALPGAVFIEVASTTIEQNLYMILLVLTRTREGWSQKAVYATAVKIGELVTLTPYLNAELIEMYIRLPTPQRSFARLSPEIVDGLKEQAGPIEDAVEPVSAVISKAGG